MMNKKELELYIHIPFCVRKCGYCDFLSFPAREERQREYLDKLTEEIRAQGACLKDRQVTTVFVGGGTPSLLPADWIEELFLVLRDSFEIAGDAEITLEANPGTLTMDKLEVYRESGINRLSLGLQSADDQELKKLGRIHTFGDFLKSFQRARQAGFDNINVDLMSALPGQTVHSWKSTLRRVLLLKPEHISAYSLIIEEGTPFYERYGGEGSAELPDEETEREMYHLTREILAAQGYERYEISNYARPGHECRHNAGYWTGVDYLGLGLGASSYLDGFRFRNVDRMEEYLKEDLTVAGAAAREIHGLSLEEKMEEFMFLGLRMSRGVSGSEFFDRFGRNLWNVYEEPLRRLEEQGLIEIHAPQIRLTDWGVDVSNRVLSEFLLELDG